MTRQCHVVTVGSRLGAQLGAQLGVECFGQAEVPNRRFVCQSTGKPVFS